MTRRVRLGTSVLLTPLHPPAVLAKQVATVDLLSNGRVLLGLGVGARPDDFTAAGVPFRGRGFRTAESIRVMRQIWSGRPLQHRGRYFTLESPPIGPTPPQGGRLSVWMGGSQEPAIRRIARMADGYIVTGAAGPAGFTKMWNRMKELLADTQRAADAFPNACLAYFNLRDDREAAKDEAMAAMIRYYGPQFTQRFDPEQALIFGPPEEFARRLQAYLDAGVQHPILVPTTLDVAQVDRIAREILPRVKGGGAPLA